jgi:hypothetical protein
VSGKMGRESRHRQSQAETDPPGTVVLLSGEVARHTSAQQCFDALEVPPGTKRLRFGGDCDVANNRNRIAETFSGSWLGFIDDDQVYRPDMLRRLLRHLQDPRVDIVTPLILRRNPPHHNVLAGPSADPAKPHETRQCILEPADRGLLEVQAAGCGVMVVRRRVFERIDRPWFAWNGPTSEDFAFCLKAKNAGCGIWCDLETRAGHILTMVVWPCRAADGQWGPAYTTLKSGSASTAAASIGRAYAQTERRQGGAL